MKDSNKNTAHSGKTTSRRTFIHQTGAAVAAGSVLGGLVPNVHAAGDDTIRIALIGCGGRGTGAVAQIFKTKGNTRLTAVADAFQPQADGAIEALTKENPDKVDVPPERLFAGLDAYKKAIDTDCDLVVIATPPGFKPPHFEYRGRQG